VPKTYTREEADEILRRALSQSQPGAAAEGISHDDLVAAAREVGIPEASILAAADQLGEHALVTERMTKLRGRKRRAFVRHLVVYLLIAGLMYLSVATDLFSVAPEGLAFLRVPMVLWAMLLVLFGFFQLAPNQEKLQKRAEREIARERRVAERQRRLAEKSRGAGRSRAPNGAKEFEAAVQEGVSALLSGAARAIRGLSPAERQGRFRVDEAEEAADAAPSERAKQRRTL
jgi:hypothetical protein